MSKATSFSLLKIMQLLLGILLCFLGIHGINNYNSFFSQVDRGLAALGGGSANVLPLIIAITNIIAGALLILELFLARTLLFLTPAKTGVVVFFLVYTIYTMFFINMNISGNSVAFKPDFWSWLVSLTGNLIYLLGLFMVSQRRA